MSRAIWKGTVSFGLVEIPVRLHSAIARQEEIAFTMLDKRDHAPIRYERVNSKTNEPVPWADIVKGYEHAPGEFVVLSPADLERANVEATQTLDIVEFVDAAEIEPVYWEAPYFLEPERKKSKSYSLLREALRRSGKVGIAKLVLRTRQRLAALVVWKDVIVANVLRYAYEVRDPAKELDLPEGSLEKQGISEKEIAMASQLVEGMSSEWDPTAFKDEYHDDVLALVEKKIKEGRGESIETKAPARKKPKADVLDLMPLLKESLEKTKRVASAAPARHRERATARKRRAS
jgi:DNA end-binding protein Ku